MNRPTPKRTRNAWLRCGLAASLLLLAACGQQASGASSSPSANTRATASAEATPTGVPRCPTQQLDISQADYQGAAGNARSIFRIVNRSASSCLLQGYPGVELVDPNGHHVADAARSLTSFFGDYPPPHAVVVAAGANTTFDLTWVQNDPCTSGVRAWRPAAFKITPPDDFDSATVNASWQGTEMLVCPNTIAVHPVGSTLVRQ